MESFEILCWRRVEKIIWTDRVRNVKKCYIKPRGKKHSITIEGRLTGLVTSCEEIAF